MADISKIEIDPAGAEYNLKDATARADIESSKTVTGNPVTVTDAYPMNAEDITVDITPKQDLHGYGRPWAGGAGKNKFDKNWITYSNLFSSAHKINILNPTYITLSAQTDGAGQLNYCGYNSEGTLVIANAALVMSGSTSGTKTVAVSNLTDGYVYLCVYKPSASPVVVSKLQVENGNQATSYEDYENICPIEGRTGAELDRVGKNWLPKSQTASFSVNGVTVTNNNDGTYTTANSASAYGVCKVLAGKSIRRGSYILSGGFTATDGVSVMLTPKNNDSVSIARSYGGDVAFTLDEDTEIDMYFTFRTHYPYAPTTIAPMIRLASITDSTYEPYQGQQYTASFGETVYGGKWHATKGGTDKTHGNIANYNGETINEPWLSSLDEYVEGATPTTGAQVVYPLTTPTTISTPKQNVPMLQGINNISANCGDVSLKYQPDNVIGELKGEIEDNIIYEDFKWTTQSSQSYSAGTPGTYGTSSWRNVAKEGYDVIGVTFVENRRFGDCILTLYYIPSTNHVEVIIFRATSSAVTIADEDIVYRVAYKKRT